MGYCSLSGGLHPAFKIGRLFSGNGHGSLLPKVQIVSSGVSKPRYANILLFAHACKAEQNQTTKNEKLTTMPNKIMFQILVS